MKPEHSSVRHKKEPKVESRKDREKRDQARADFHKEHMVLEKEDINEKLKGSGLKEHTGPDRSHKPNKMWDKKYKGDGDYTVERGEDHEGTQVKFHTREDKAKAKKHLEDSGDHHVVDHPEDPHSIEIYKKK